MATIKRKTARAVLPNVGVQMAYKRAMEKLIDEMSNSFEYWLAAAYKANPPRMEVAMDALPSAELSKKVRDLGKRWIKKFDDMAASIAQKFTESGRKATDSSFQQALKDAGFSVEFKVTPVMRDAMNATIADNVALIKSIPRQYATQVEGIIMRGYASGRDLKSITDDLQERYGITHRRAAFIARDQSNKLNAVVTRARRVELGLFKARWRHSGAGKEPRPSHVKAGKEKKEFDVREGCLIDGKHILPGEDPGCRCSSETILPF